MDAIKRHENTIEVLQGVIHSLECRLNSVSVLRKWTYEWKLLSRKLKRLEIADEERGVMQRRVARLEAEYAKLLREFESLSGGEDSSKRQRTSAEKKERLALEASLRCSKKENAALRARLQLQEKKIEEMELKVDESRHGMRMCMRAAKKAK